MSGVSGETAQAAVKAAPRLAVVLMSGYSPEGTSYPDDWRFLRKPLDITELSFLLADCCD